MLHMYQVKYTLYHEGEKVDSIVNGYPWYFIEDFVPIERKVIDITWDNVEQVKNEYHGLFIPLFIKKKRKGLVVMNKIKQWKTHSLNLQLIITCRLYTPSIKEVLEYSDGDKAIQYLVERGVQIKI